MNKMQWKKVSEHFPDEELGTIWAARWVEDSGILSYGELCLVEKDTLRYDVHKIKRGWKILEKIEWLDENPLAGEDLISSLKSGMLLLREHHNDPGCREWIFWEEGGGYQIRGWGTAGGKAIDRIFDILEHPEEWKIWPHPIGEIPPWNSLYKNI
jgi:hypothetical protein